MSGNDPTPPAHAGVPTTAMPAHAAVPTTAVPAHSGIATTAMPAQGGGAPPTAVRSRQASYDVGETIQVGPHRLVIDRLLFVGGQAELYLVSGGPAPVTVLKLYTHGARPKADVLARWRLLPPTAVIGLIDADPHAEPRAWELLVYAEGGTLTPPGPVRDPARLRLITLQAAEALHVLHTIGNAVHRDVSPDNFLWLDAAHTRLVLADLGSSSIMSEGAARSVTIRGKLPFMAPEELLPMGDGVVVGEAADFYALGIMVLTLWAGHHPFVGREADQIALKSRGAVPMPDDLPPDFRSLVEALLLPANIRLSYDGIKRWAAGEAIPRTTTARSVTYPRLTVRPAQGNPYDVDTAAALARFLRDEPVAGERFLYAWNMREWASSDAGMVADLTDIVEQEFPKNRAAGRQKAAYLLDATLPFAAPDGPECRDYAALSAWLEADESRPKALKDPAHPLWLYLATRPENELREAMAEIAGDVREGKPEATALIRHYLMQYGTAGSWRDSDGTLVTDLTAFIGRLPSRALPLFYKLRDPADPLLLWLETQRPGTALRGGRLRALSAPVIGTVSAVDWIACVLNQVPTVLGPPLVNPEDSWREELWPPAMKATVEQISTFLDAWWRVVEDQRFESAALAWLAGGPSSGARRAVAGALLGAEWAATNQPLSAVLATCFTALPAYSGDPGDTAVLTEDASRASTIGQSMSRSPEAVKAYLAAREAMRRGLVDSADASITRAVAIDSTFGLALTELVVVRSWTQFMRGQPFRNLREIASRARAHSDSLNPRNRLRLDAVFANIETNGRAAAHAYQTMIERDSMDVEAWDGLAFVQNVYGWQYGATTLDALASAERALSLDSTFAPAVSRRAHLSPELGLDDVVQQIGRLRAIGAPGVLRPTLRALEAITATDPDYPAFEDSVAAASLPEWTAVFRRLRSYRPDRALTLIRKVAARGVTQADFAWTALGYLQIATGRPEQVDSTLNAVGSGRPLSEFLLRSSILAAASLGIGDSATSQEAVTRLGATLSPDSAAALLESQPVWRLGWTLGAYHAAHGDTAMARRWADALAGLQGGGNPPRWNTAEANDIRSRIWRRAGRADSALAYARAAYDHWPIRTENTSDDLPEPGLRFSLAEQLHGAGKSDSAAALFRSMVAPTTWLGSYTARSLLHLGEIAEAAGDRVEAGRRFDQALLLWELGGPAVALWRKRAESGLARVGNRPVRFGAS